MLCVMDVVAIVDRRPTTLVKYRYDIISTETTPLFDAA